MRLTVQKIAATLDSENPGLFKASKGLILVTDWNPDMQTNTEGVYISRPDININLQTATVDYQVSVYDEEIVFDVMILTTRTNSNFDAARDAIEALAVSKEFQCYYSKSYVADEEYNGSNLMVEYTFTLKRTVTKTQN